MSKTSDTHAASADLAPDRTLDITGLVCPMTFVRTRLALDCMASGQTLLVLLRGEEPARNVPATAAAQGHRVLAQRDGEDGVVRLWLRRA
jgi:tRNA 2-thiouridine synthesizing protein A